ncbi:hypothetical protein IV432_15205 [Enterococcus gallinarum]|uniref:hypothetical protein n=1 Tax=Enterococcus gallinarum TaxID=1353 RepID=UPI001E3C5A8F|nr:hypothetical protein [Enterococcus gallinarum]MCD5156413.1 hypothetical protein [Enterococcus gallinarum]
MTILEGRYESLFITELTQSNNRFRRVKKIDYYTLGAVYVRNDINIFINHRCLDNLFPNSLERTSVLNTLNKKIEEEQHLINYRNDIFYNIGDVVNAIIFLHPIELFDEFDNCSYIIPKMYLYNDGREIINFSYDFNDTNITGNHYITKKIKSFSYFKIKKEVAFWGKIRGNTFVKRVSEEKEYEDINNIINDYCHELMTFFNNNQLVQTYTNIYINTYSGKYKKKKELEKVLFSLSKFPYSLIPSTLEIQEKKDEFQEILFFTNTKRMVTAAIDKMYKLIDNSDIHNDITLMGNTQVALETVLLKKFSEMKTGLEILDKTKRIKDPVKINADRMRYTMTDNVIMFSNYETGIELYEILKSKILLEEQMNLFNEFRDVTKIYFESLSSKREKGFENFLSIFGLFLTIIFSFEPIKAISKELGFENIAFLLYLIVNSLIVILLIVRNKYKNKDGV